MWITHNIKQALSTSDHLMLMESGQIIGGADPVVAVQFQILINFALLTCATLSSIILGFLIYPTMFNEQMQKLKLGH